MKRIFFLLSVFSICISCENGSDDFRERTKIETRENLDMSENAISKRWFESVFETSFESVKNISGNCLNWGRDGTCSYTIEIDVNTTLKPINTFIAVPCQEINKGFTRFFPNESESIELKDSVCKKHEVKGSNKYIVNLVGKNTHYFWESYIVQ